MKLGVVIKITNSGVSEAYSINKKEDWARYAGDVRPAINTLNGFDGSGKSIIIAKFLGELGYLLCLIKARPEGSGRGGDNVSAWIHIPSNCDLSNSEVVDLLIQVESAISASTGIDIESLKELFEKEYITNNVMVSASSRIVSNNSNGFAIRYYNGEYTLKELLGSKIAQKEYSSYQSIIFVDKQMGIGTQGDILDFEPKEICTYEPLTKINGFTPCFLSNGKYIPFDRAIEVPTGEQATVYWYKDGYSIIKKSFLAGDDSQYPQAVLINPNEYKIIVKRENFHIYDPNSIPVKNPEISINGMLMTGDSMEIPESSYNEGVRLLIRAKGFADYRNEKEKLSRNMQIIMGHHFYHYDFEIPLQGEEEQLSPALFSIETRHKLKHCPIQGYETENLSLCESNRGVNQLIVNDNWKIKVKYFLYGIASVIVAGIIYAGCQALDNYEFQLGWPPIKEIKSNKVPTNEDTDRYQQDNQEVEEQEDVNVTSAIKYLDGTDVWNKDSLDFYDVTRGLYEELNEFKCQNVVNRYNASLMSSNRLKQVKEALERNSNEGFDPRKGKEGNDGRYNPENDKKISVPNYIDWLSTEHSAATHVQTNGSHTSRINGAPIRDTEVRQGTDGTSKEHKPRRGEEEI